MANVKFEVVRFALSTAAAGNTQDVTISGFGTPKAAMFFTSGGTTDDTIASNFYKCVGWTDGTNENACGGSERFDGASSTATARAHRTDCCILRVTTSASIEARFSFNSWITDGIRLDIDVAAPEATLVTCVLIGGSDVSGAFVGSKDDLGTGTSAVDITGVGFTPDLVFLTTVGSPGPAPDSRVPHIFSFGVAHNDGSDTQRFTATAATSSTSTATNAGYISNQSAIGQIDAGSLTWRGTVGSFDSDGFSITPSVSTASDVVFYLCLSFSNSPDIALFDMSWPTSGNYAETSPGFEPSFGLISSLASMTSRNTAKASSIFADAVSVFDGTSIFTESITHEDAVTTINAKSLSSDQLRLLNQDGATNDVVASSYAFDSAGWDFTLSTNPASAVLGWGLAIGVGATAAAGIRNPLGGPMVLRNPLGRM